MLPRTTTNTTDHRTLIILLRVFGVLCCTTVFACVMPTTWIAEAHQWFGLGDFPDAPITQYLARSISALYAIFGVLTILVSTDVLRYAPIIRFLAYVTLAFAVLITGIDWMAGLPTYWTLLEGPPTFILGIVILLLVRRVQRRNGSGSRPMEH